MRQDRFNKIKDTLVSYFSLTDYIIPQEEAEAAIREGISFRGTNILILIFAILIASLGLNTNSTAVIIGAMLISPLMGPIIGVGLGVGIHDFTLIKRSVRNLAMATGFSILASTIYFLISPVNEGHSELLARTSPTIYDVLIGFFGGCAGIIGIGSRSKGNVIPGVAIATALMPPLCTVGYGLATAQPHYFIGAFYLFLINSIYIAFATTVGVKLMKYQHVQFVNEARARKVRRIVYAIVIITMLPSVYLTWSMLRQNQYSMHVRQFVTKAMNFPDTQVLSYNETSRNGQRVLEVTLIGRLLPVDSLRLALTPRLADFGLDGTRLNFIQGDDRPLTAITSGQLNSSSVKDIYQASQNAISRQQSTIDSLRYVNSWRERQDTISATISPEIKVLFPEVSEIAIAPAVFSATDHPSLDTMTVALVKYTRPMAAAQRDKFKAYLQARVQARHISLIDIGSAVTFPNRQKERNP